MPGYVYWGVGLRRSQGVRQGLVVYLCWACSCVGTLDLLNLQQFSTEAGSCRNEVNLKSSCGMFHANANFGTICQANMVLLKMSPDKLSDPRGGTRE